MRPGSRGRVLPARGVALALLVLLAACDNMTWGGTDLALVRPAPKNPTAEAEESDPEEVLPPLPEGPSLFLVRQTSTGARLLAVAEITDSVLRAHPDEASHPGARGRFVSDRMAPGSQFHVFADGRRVGRFIAAAGHAVDTTLCAPRPSVPGVLEVIPSAAGVQDFLALPDSFAGNLPHGSYDDLPSSRGDRAESRRLFAEQIPVLGARWPQNLDAARAELRLFNLSGNARPAMSSTYLFRDGLETRPGRAGGYAMLILAEPGADRYEPRYVWYRRTDQEGKGAPTMVGQLDWNRDGQTDALLRVFGDDREWLAALSRSGASGWSLSYEDACGSAASASP